MRALELENAFLNLCSRAFGRTAANWRPVAGRFGFAPMYAEVEDVSGVAGGAGLRAPRACARAHACTSAVLRACVRACAGRHCPRGASLPGPAADTPAGGATSVAVTPALLLPVDTGPPPPVSIVLAAVRMTGPIAATYFAQFATR